MHPDGNCTSLHGGQIQGKAQLQSCQVLGPIFLGITHPTLQ
jgi:hypothetical protein